ncbi:MAG TPA: sensor domain-containing diguanylate cyclase [Dissulfurispiraceae bacterium]|nr:sensor domain-containing diguanylate cyclase [Dissulfurispiraceae bacterium]
MLENAIAKGLNSLAGLTGLHFHLYDDLQLILAASTPKDKLLSLVNSNPEIHGLYKKFLDTQLKLSIIRQEPFVVKGLTGQYHAFIPLQAEGKNLTAVAEAFYMDKYDFKRFYDSDYGQMTGVSGKAEEEWLKVIRICSDAQIKSILSHAKSILQTIVSSELNNDRLNKYSQQSRTIISIMSDINSDYSVRNLYQIVVDAVIFLFDIDTAAFFVRKDGQYRPEVMEGRGKQAIKDLNISVENSFISKVTSDESSITTMNSHELLHAGFPDSINNVTLFPFTTEAGLLGILAIFNSQLDKQACESIANLCKLTAYLCGVRRRREEIDNVSDQLRALSIQASSLYSLYHEPSRLFEGIVSEAANLVNAEKCSLMLPHNTETLEVRAATGTSRWLMENVKVRKGDGIAGKVYEKGLPALINGDDTFKNYGATPRSHYKTSSALSLPLMMAGEIIGVLNLSDKRSGGAFSEHDISMLSPFILQAATLLKLCVCNDTLEEMKKLSMTDALTSLFNRRYFDVRLEEEFLRAKRYNLTLSLAIMDVDDFKSFNDSEGHVAGDHILREVAHIMTYAVRSHDILARIGGEEFAIIMPQTSKTEAFKVTERIRESIKSNITRTWKKYPKSQLTICGGIATFPDCCSSKDDLIRNADRALYQAKKLGKDLTIFWK